MNTSDKNNARQVAINVQFVKDLSFENPNAPLSLIAPKSRPEIHVNVDINAKTLQDTAYEVALNVSARASADGNQLFLADLTYAGVFNLINIPDNEREQILMIYCPTMLFPFARRIMCDITRDGGFPPLMLEPMDFAALFYQRKQQAGADEESSRESA